MLYFLLVVLLLVAIVVIFINTPKFGRTAHGSRQAEIMRSPNFKDGSFKNLSFTPQLTEGASFPKLLTEFLFLKKFRSKPAAAIPSVKTDLLALDRSQNILVWMGHSSYFLQIEGKRMLVDPVFSGAASPIAATTRAFPGTDRYAVSDIPELDFLFISHDHWDHLDYSTVSALRPKVKLVLCGLGVADHLERWGYERSMIHEKDWYDKVDLPDGFKAYVMPARHFSGHGLSRNQSLWISIVLETPKRRIYLGGDSGYDHHFADIGSKFDGFDLAILENGQYNKNWKYIHMMPEETVQAAVDLKARSLLAFHNSKFALALHPWDEPLIRVSTAATNSAVRLLTPMIGEAVLLDDFEKTYSKWWNGVE